MIFNDFKKNYLSLFFIIVSFISEFSYAEDLIDLTVKGDSAMAEQAVFYIPTLEFPGGTGVIDSFVRIQGAGSGTESGYNTYAYSNAGDVESEFDFTTTPNFFIFLKKVLTVGF